MGLLKSLFGGEPKPGKPLETTDETFDEDVLKSDLPAVVDFWSPTCTPCQVMGGLLRELGPEYAGRVKIFKLNVSIHDQVAEAFRIQGVPTLVFIRNGKVVDRIVGLAPIDVLRERFDRLAPAAAARPA